MSKPDLKKQASPVKLQSANEYRESLASSRPTCARCGELIWSNYYEWVGDSTVHEDRCP